MGKGIDLARPDAPLHAEVLDNFKDQLLIVLIRRLGETVSVPIDEVDDTGRFMLAFSIHDGAFHFKLRRKS